MARFIQNPTGPGSGLRTVAPGENFAAENIQQLLNPEPTLPVEPASAVPQLQREANFPPSMGAALDVPRPMFPGLAGVQVQPQVQDRSSLVESTQNPVLFEPQYQPQLDEQGNVMRDAQGQVITQEVPLDQYALEQQRQLSGLRDFSSVGMDEFGESSAETARKIFEQSNEAGYTNYTPAKIEQKVETAATDLENSTQKIRNELFSDRTESVKIPKIDPETGEMYTSNKAAGTEILEEAGFHGDNLVNAMKVVAPYLALSTAQAVTQMPSENSSAVDPMGDNVDATDTASEVNVINSIASSLNNALANRGLNLPGDATYKLAQATFAGKLANGDFLEYMDKRGNPIYVAAKRLKDESSALSDLSAAVAGMKRVITVNTRR